MIIISRLIWKEWLKTFIGACLVLFVLITVAQLISGFLRTSVTPNEVMINYVLEIPSTFSKVFPLACLLSTLFSVNKLKSKSELIAIFAAGYSRKHFVSTLLQVSILIGLLQFINVSYLDPFAKNLHKDFIIDGWRKFKQTKSKGLLSSVINSGKIWYRSDNYYMAYTYYDRTNNTLSDVTIFYFNDQHEGTSIIRAKSAKGDEFGNWVFSDAVNISDIQGSQFPRFQREEELTLSLNEAPSDFGTIESDLNTLGPVTLYNFIEQISQSGISVTEYKIFFYDKLISVLICPIFALFPIGLIFTPNRRSSSFGRNVFGVLIFAVLYWGLYSASVSLGNAGSVPPLLAVSFVPILFCFYFVYIFYRNRELS